MAPPNPKSRSRTPGSQPGPRRRSTLEIELGEDLEPLRADDPRPQRVAQLPSRSRRPVRKAEEAIPTSFYQQEKDEEFSPSYDADEVSDPGYKPAFLYVERGPGAGQLVPVKQGAMIIGRASVSELRLQHPSISRRHAQLTRRGESFCLRDLGSQNGTFVNRTRIATEVEIQVGDEISLGNALLKLRGPVQPALLGEDGEPVDDTRLRRRRRRGGGLRTGLLGGLVGFAVAGVFLFGVYKVMKGPSYHPLPSSSAPAAEEPREAAAVGESDAVNERIQKAMKEAAAKNAQNAGKPAPEPAPAIAAASTTVSRVAPASRHHASQSHDSASPKTRAVLAKYEAGDVGAAIEMAQQGGHDELAHKLSRFQTAYAAGKAELDAKNASGALRAYAQALKLDEQISKGGWSRFNGELRKQLSALYTLSGFKHLENEDTGDAQKAFAQALKMDPDNAKAKQQLDKLAGEGPSTRKKKIDDAWGDGAPTPKSPAAAADAAFGDEPAPKSSARRPARSNTIDAAFGN